MERAVCSRELPCPRFLDLELGLRARRCLLVDQVVGLRDLLDDTLVST
jgi:hypothetical protein